MSEEKSAQGRKRVERILQALKGAHKVAIIRLGSVGDVIATLPFAWLLRELLPDNTRLAWIAHPAEAKLLEGVRAIDEILTLPRASILKAIPSWRKRLRGAGIDAVFDLHANLKSAIVSLSTGAAIRIGLDPADCREYWNRLATNYKLPRLSSGNKTRRALEAAALLGHASPAIRFDLEFTLEESNRAASVLDSFPAGRPITVLQLGRLQDVRSWPPEHFVELARELAASGRQVLVLGGPQELETGRLMKSLLGEDDTAIRFEVGTLSLREVGALFQALSRDSRPDSVFLGADSGCLHLAAASGLRTIGLHGPHPPERTAPIGPNFEAIYHPEAADCIPCGRRECNHQVQSFCMRSIAPGEVLERLTEEKPSSSPVPIPRTEGAASPRETGLEAKTRSERRAEAVQASALVLTAFVLTLISSNAWSAGLVYSAAALAGTVLLTYLQGRRGDSHWTGLLSGASLLFMWGFVKSSRLAFADSMFCFLINASFLFYLEMERGRGKVCSAAALSSSVAAAGALIPGGLRGLVLPLVSVITFHAGEKNLHRLLERKAALFFLSALSFAGAFLLFACLARGPEALERVLSSGWSDSVPSARPFWFPFSTMFLEALPASLLAPFVLFSHFRIRRYREDLGFADRRWRFPKAALCGGLAFLSLLPSKRLLDVLPLFPMLALLSGVWLERLFFDTVRTRKEPARKEPVRE